MARWRLTRAAADDLVAIYRHGLAQFGADQADRYHDQLADTFAFLAKYPGAARERFEITPPVRIHRHKAHLIVYETVHGGVLILRIRHGREDWADER